MSMYVQVLSSALDDLPGELPGDALVEWTVSRRIDMRRVTSGDAGPSLASLVAEVAFDRALLKLCERYDIESEPARFLHPTQERNRLESELALVGIDLAALCDLHPDG